MALVQACARAQTHVGMNNEEECVEVCTAQFYRSEYFCAYADSWVWAYATFQGGVYTVL